MAASLSAASFCPSRSRSFVTRLSIALASSIEDVWCTAFDGSAPRIYLAAAPASRELTVAA